MYHFVDLITELEKRSNDKEILYFDRFGQYSLNDISNLSNVIASKLIFLNVKKGDPVIVYLPHSCYYVISMLAIFRLNAIYVPINESTPIDKVKKIIAKTNAKAIITSSKFKVNNIKVKKIYFESIKNNKKVHSYISKIDKNDIAYIVTTSGSTGEPKLIVHTHNSIMFHLNHHYEIDEFNFDTKTIAAVVTNFAHVPSIHFAFSPIIKHSVAFIPDLKILNRADIFYDFLLKNKINYTVLPPGIREQLLENYDLSKIRVQVLGDKIRNFTPKYKTHVLNLYGSSETLHTCYGLINGNEKHIPLGKIIKDVKYILFSDNKKIIAKEGVGELLLSSNNFFKGYLNDIKLTKDKYIIVNGIKYLRTFDNVRKDKNNILYYVGRIDNMVKIRGFRVELEEVENAINDLKIKQIKNIAVSAKIINDTNTLCCYYESSSEIDDLLVKKKLAKKILDYMIPTYFIRIDKLPRNANGKIARNLLPAPSLNSETTILNSIDLIRLSSESFKNEGIDIKFVDLMKVHTLGEFMRLKETYKTKNAHVLKSYHKNIAPITSVQRNLLMFYDKHPNELSINLPHLIRLDNSLDIKKIQNALKMIVQTHPSLNIHFKKTKGTINQYIKIVNPIIPYIEIKKNELNKVINKLVKPFDIYSLEPLYRFIIIKASNDLYLFFDINHVIFDGTSIDILLKDFSLALEKGNLDKENGNYLDFAIDENNYKNSENYRNDQKFWEKEISSNIIATLIDSDLNYNKTYGDDLMLSKKIDTKKIQKIAHKYNCSLSSIYLGITLLTINSFIKKNNKNIGISIMSSGRNQACLNSLYGFFSKIVPFVFTLEDEYNRFFKSVQNKLIDVIEHEKYDITSKLENFKSYILFAYQENLIDIKNNIYVKEIINLERGGTSFPLKIFVVSRNDECFLNFSYIKKMYSKKIALSFIDKYFSIIDKLAN